ncbi:osmotically inducible protein OsmC [Halopolyspora algeriensis]|uniref:Osmotically inducible protein OsmC n=1 Tax=Halopolyspora algeriensis TaxID=1500506 RepID=A0A368W118_9ACTN|nr:OsmC family protein [Halopolyspora algeriensis]RCW46914.1 osmotically inducible protein OsmC [Halopolyspora algeriensis]TQM48005.1 osmotically inducible protein OsmC [Halopolyspora algeriensis]
MADRNATTTWSGDLSSGSGTVTLDSSNSGRFPVSWSSRTAEPEGRTSPEELVAAAHSSCYSMQLSGLLTEAGTPPQTIDTSAEVTFGQSGGGYAITGIALTVRATVPGADRTTFDEAAQKAKEICPVSAALAGTTITLDATLV